MTREQAKREIDSLDYYLQNHTDDYGEESHTAMMMAIKALEELPKRRKEAKRWRAKAHQIAGESYENGYLAGQKNVAERCENAISKADVKNAMYKVCLYEENKDIFVKLLDEINKLPSVNPQPICEEREKGECPYYAG